MLSRFIAILSLAAMLVACCGTDMRARTIEPQMMIDLNDATAALVEPNTDGSYGIVCSAVWLSSKRLATAGHCVADAGMDDLDRMIAELTGLEWDPMGKRMHFLTWRDTLGSVGDKPIMEANVGIVVAYDRDNDLALVEAADGTLDHGTASVAWTAPVQGELVHSVGMSLGLSWSYTPGIVGAVRTQENVRGKQEKVFQVVSGAHRGNSGGGLFDGNGRLVGICSYMATGSALIFYIHTDPLRAFIQAN